MYFLRVLLFFLLAISTNACKKSNHYNNTIDKANKEKYAEGFSIKKHKGHTMIYIHKPYTNTSKTMRYLLVPKTDKIPACEKSIQIIRTPVEKIVTTSSTHIPILELLNVERSLVGFPNTSFISSKKTRQLINEKKVLELGESENINMERLLALKPDLVMSFAIDDLNKSFHTIKKMGIPVLLNGDWIEKTPLGRVEWIYVFGALYQKEQEADRIFKQIEREYNTIKKLALSAKTKPTILSGAIFKDVWYLPGGKSFMAHYFKDAQTNYLWRDNNQSGSLALSFEKVLEKAKNATFWIGCDQYETKEHLVKGGHHYRQFNPFLSDNIYTSANCKGEKGGLLYFELGPIQPHIVLKDIVKITHPELLPDYQPFFFEKLI